SDSPAHGFSPQIRSLRPNRVRHSSQAVSGTHSNASTVKIDTLATNPRSSPAASEMTKMSQSLMVPSTSAIPGTVNLSNPLTRGDCDTEPPDMPLNTRSDR